MLNTTKIMRSVLVISLLLSMTACGFHLRGSAPVFEDAKIVYVAAPRGSFEEKLKDALTVSGANVVRVNEGVDLFVHVSNARSSRDIGTLNQRGTVDSYRVGFVVEYSVFDGAGTLLSGPHQLNDDRQYVFESSLVVESEYEEQALIESMEDDIVLRVLNQLSALNTK